MNNGLPASIFKAAKEAKNYSTSDEMKMNNNEIHSFDCLTKRYIQALTKET